jgi:hypothetical protein
VPNWQWPDLIVGRTILMRRTPTPG